MNSKVVLLIAFSLVNILFAKEKATPDGDIHSSDEEIVNVIKNELGDAPKRPYTDNGIIALIKKELKERESMHQYFEFSSTSTEYDPELEDFSSTIDIQQLLTEAWQRFGDDIPLILKTMAKLNEAKISLDFDYNQYANYGEYIQSIKNKIKALLVNYNVVYAKTNELIELIGHIYTIIHKNDNLRRLLFLNQPIDNDDNDDIEYKAWQTFSDDIPAIQKTMKKIKDSIDAVSY
eukprot:UN05660